MKNTIYICDHCGREIEQWEESFVVNISYAQHDETERNYTTAPPLIKHVCKGCVDTLIDFLRVYK